MKSFVEHVAKFCNKMVGCKHSRSLKTTFKVVKEPVNFLALYENS